MTQKQFVKTILLAALLVALSAASSKGQVAAGTTLKMAAATAKPAIPVGAVRPCDWAYALRITGSKSTAKIALK